MEFPEPPDPNDPKAVRDFMNKMTEMLSSNRENLTLAFSNTAWMYKAKLDSFVIAGFTRPEAVIILARRGLGD